MEANESAINSTDWNTTAVAAVGDGEQKGSVTWADVVMVTALSLVIAVTMVNKPALMFACKKANNLEQATLPSAPSNNADFFLFGVALR